MDISPLLALIRPGWDVVVKHNEKKVAVVSGHDLDILTLDAKPLVQSLVRLGCQVGERVKVAKIPDGAVQVDVFFAESDFFRFDIREDFGNWRRIRVRKELVTRMVSEFEEVETIGAQTVPGLNRCYNAAFKYLEYINYFWTGDDKLKHVEWIKQNLTEEEWSDVLEFTHRYVEPPLDTLSYRASYFIRRITLALSRIGFMTRVARKLMG